MRSLVLRTRRVQSILEQARFRFAAITAVVAAADLISKAVAVRSLGDTGLVTVSDRFSLFVVYNTGGAGGAMVGPYTMHINVLVTLVAVALIAWVVEAMASVDGRSTRALAFVAGGAIGNLSSMLWGPEGVADFLAIRLGTETTVVANVADFALWAGAAMLAPVALLLFRLVRAERAAMVRVTVGAR
jgi:signal peptidase II